jgi:hypothetical protein
LGSERREILVFIIGHFPFLLRNLGFGLRSSVFGPWVQGPQPKAVLRRHLCQAVTEGVNDQFQAIGDFKFGKNGAEMVGNGGFANE